MAADPLIYVQEVFNQANKAIKKSKKSAKMSITPILLLACFSLSVSQDEQEEINKWGKT